MGRRRAALVLPARPRCGELSTLARARRV
jgi:hypothetical protein